MTFEEVVYICLLEKELIKQFNRLYNHKLSVPRSPITIQIDNACGYDPNHEAMNDFFSFVFQYIWLPLVMKEYDNENY